MENLPIVQLEGADTSKGTELILNQILFKFAKENIGLLGAYVAEFPETDGHAQTAKEDALYWIARRFVNWLADPKIQDPIIPKL